MNVKMQLKLSYEPAAPVWGDNALISFDDKGATLHALGENPLLSVQRAARKLDGQGLRKIELIGDAWTLETCWHFYLGLKSAKRVFDIQFPTLSLEEQKTLNARMAATDWTCEIINQSAQEVGPKQLAVRAGEFIKSQAPNPEYVSYKIISAPDLLEEGWVGTYTVGRGSARKPTVLVLDFNPTGDNNAPVFACVVGKGITFDSGGYSLKPSNFMDAMKSDMGGAALATAGLGLAIAQGLNQRVKLILCCAENMVSNNAYKLGDIITYRNGKTVEVLNTDAEGRLVLADGLLYANECKPTLTIDCATLTGAAKMALGNDYHALFSFDQALAERVLRAAQHEGEGMWQLPLAEFHRNMLPSSFADMANVCSGQYTPGASTAAAFLSHFVDNYTQGWVHLDCAATYRKTGSDLWSAGATGVGIRTLAKVLLDESKA